MFSILLFLVILLPSVESDKALLNCFNRTANRALTNVAPIIELWDVNPYECLHYCIYSVSNQNEKCWSVVYHKNYWSCQLYRQRYNETPVVPVPSYGHDYYLRISDQGELGNCSSPEFPTVDSTCPEDQITAYLTTLGYELAGDGGLVPRRQTRQTGNDVVVVLEDVDEEDCSQYCTANVGPDEEPLNCKAVNYYPISKTCETHSFKAEPNGPGTLEVNDEAIYAEKYCLPVDAPEICENQVDLFFLVYLDTSLSIDPFEMTTAKTMTECVDACVLDEDCKSATYKEEEEECLLFSVHFGDNPDHQIEEPGSIYIENGCTLNTGSRCLAGQQPAYIVHFAKEVEFAENLAERSVTLPDLTEEECADYCSSNTRPDGESIECASINYHPNGEICEMHQYKGPPHGPGDFVENDEIIYAEKFCLPEDTHDECKDADTVFFLAYEEETMVGNDITSMQAINLEECIHFCILAGEQCKTVVFDSNLGADEGDNCDLKSLNKGEEGGDDAVRQAAPGIVLVENGCHLHRTRGRAAVIFQGRQQRKATGKRFTLKFPNSKGRRLKIRKPTTTPAPTEEYQYYYEEDEDVTDPNAFPDYQANNQGPTQAVQSLGNESEWTLWTPCQFKVKGVTVRVRTKDCNIFDCPPDSLQVQRCD